MTDPSSDPRTGDLATLAVLVVNYGTHVLLEQNLRRSLGADFAGRVVVVDNFSSQAEREAVTRVCADRGWTCLPSDNVGFGGGNNLAAQEAITQGATELLLVNPDAWLERDAIERLHAQVVADPLLMVAPQVMRPDGRMYSDENDVYLDHGEMLWTRLRPADASPERIHTWVSGACVMLGAALWASSGGFDDDYFLYWEDVDLCRRVVEAGGRVRVDHDVEAVHDEGSSQQSGGSGLKSAQYFYYNGRNRLLYAAKHLTRDDQRRWLRATPGATYRLAKQGGRRQFLQPHRSLWPAVRGSWAGARYLRASRRRA